MTSSSNRTACTAAAACAALLLTAWPDPSLAVKLVPRGEPPAADQQGAAVVVLPDAAKVTTVPPLPPVTGGGAGFGGTASGLPVIGAASVSLNATYDVVAEPGDPSGARLCLSYALEADRFVTITGTGASSVGTAIGGIAGYTQDFTTQPVQIGLASPLQLRVQRESGPLEVVMSVGPIAEVHTSTVPLADYGQAGTFVVRAGDSVQVEMRAGVVGRGEDGSTTNSFVRTQLRFVDLNCHNAPAPVPSLAPLALGALSALLVLAGLLARRRHARR